MSAAVLLLFVFFALCYSQVRRTHTVENPVTVTFLSRNRELRSTYHENGNVKSECQYSSERLDGFCREFFENGILKSRIEFRNGREHGTAVFYRESGARLMRVRFNRGKPRETLHYDERGLRIESEGDEE